MVAIVYIPKPIKTRNSKFPGRLGPSNILGTKLYYGKKNSKHKILVKMVCIKVQNAISLN